MNALIISLLQLFFFFFLISTNRLLQRKCFSRWLNITRATKEAKSLESRIQTKAPIREEVQDLESRILSQSRRRLSLLGSRPAFQRWSPSKLPDHDHDGEDVSAEEGSEIESEISEEDENENERHGFLHEDEVGGQNEQEEDIGEDPDSYISDE